MSVITQLLLSELLFNLIPYPIFFLSSPTLFFHFQNISTNSAGSYLPNLISVIIRVSWIPFWYSAHCTFSRPIYLKIVLWSIQFAIYSFLIVLNQYIQCCDNICHHTTRLNKDCIYLHHTQFQQNPHTFHKSFQISHFLIHICLYQTPQTHKKSHDDPLQSYHYHITTKNIIQAFKLSSHISSRFWLTFYQYQPWILYSKHVHNTGLDDMDWITWPVHFMYIMMPSEHFPRLLQS